MAAPNTVASWDYRNHFDVQAHLSAGHTARFKCNTIVRIGGVNGSARYIFEHATDRGSLHHPLVLIGSDVEVVAYTFLPVWGRVDRGGEPAFCRDAYSMSWGENANWCVSVFSANPEPELLFSVRSQKKQLFGGIAFTMKSYEEFGDSWYPCQWDEFFSKNDYFEDED
jgi:hypothetical protein